MPLAVCAYLYARVCPRVCNSVCDLVCMIFRAYDMVNVCVCVFLHTTNTACRAVAAARMPLAVCLYIFPCLNIHSWIVV
jgi:hypothetical protein